MPALLAFLARPLVRYIGICLLILSLILFVNHRFNSFKESLREEGRVQMAEKYRGIVKQNDADNRRIERDVQGSLDAYGKRLEASLSRMDAKQQAMAQSTLKIIRERPQIFNNPVCNTPQDVMDARNDIRKQGPR